jgi:tRNA threonylcarbamoyladenosine biosynthesis protein TsaE
MIDVITKTPQECIELGEKISTNLKPGDIISLEGDLGAGKTTFVKGILKGLNYKHSVTSPTFTLVNEYIADTKVIHIDFYRENSKKRWDIIGLNEYLYSNNIVILEWGNIVKELLPHDMIYIYMEHIGLNKRRIYSKYEFFSN